jgi:hypothetical protein
MLSPASTCRVFLLRAREWLERSENERSSTVAKNPEHVERLSFVQNSSGAILSPFDSSIGTGSASRRAVRISVGIEDVEDLIADLEQVLAAAQPSKRSSRLSSPETARPARKRNSRPGKPLSRKSAGVHG